MRLICFGLLAVLLLCNLSLGSSFGKSQAGGHGGDNGPAIKAALNAPSGVAVDDSGDVFIADTRDNVIRRVDAKTGIITTVVGMGIACFTPGVNTCGDGGPATSARLDEPMGVAVDSAGNVFVADSQDQKIRRADAKSGVIATVGGNGAACSSDNSTCGDGGPAIQAALSFPEGVAVDANANVYVADTFDNRVRKIDPAGNISGVAGNGNAGFSGDGGAATSAGLSAPVGVAVGPAGDIYIADTGNHRIRRVAGGLISTVAGNGTPGAVGDGGLATDAELNFPEGIAVDSSGNLFIADTFNSLIRRVDAKTHIISVFAGNGALCTNGTDPCGDGGPALNAALDSPAAVAVDSFDNVFIADTEDHRIRRVDAKTGTISTTAGNGTPGFISLSAVPPGGWITPGPLLGAHP